MADATLPGLLLTGDHASRPAATAVGSGALYSCSTHSLVYQSDAASWSTWASLAGTGAVATDAIWDAAGDLAVGSGANTAARLAIGATNGMALQRVSGAVAWALPPGYEFDYVQKTTNTTITATTEGGADTVLTGNAVTYDGSTIVMVEWWSPQVSTPAASGGITLVALYEGATILGYFNGPTAQAVANEAYGSQSGRYRFTPSAASHTYHIKALVTTGTGTVSGGAGGTGAFLPTFMRITKV